MICRKIYRAQYQREKQDDIISWLKAKKDELVQQLELGQLMALSVFRWERNLFLYYECVDGYLEPHHLYPEAELFLEAWPGEEEARYWIPMVDIFHYNKPMSEAHWKRKIAHKTVQARLAILKPEMVSSYVFYHYQYQEEKAREREKYGMIGLHENLLFMYTEEPGESEIPEFEGKLQTANTPENWHETMIPHFVFWSDTGGKQEIWRNIEAIL